MSNIASKDRPGSIEVYDGRNFAGSILAQGDRWVAFDEHGHQIGTHTTERAASAAVYAARKRP